MRSTDRSKRRKAHERGIALVMVTGAIAVMMVMWAEFQDQTSAEFAAALAEQDNLQAEYMARSAVNLSRLLIASEPTIRTAISPLFMMMKKAPPQIPVWEFSDRLLGVFNDEESAKGFAGTVGLDLSLSKNIGMNGGRYQLVIVDEDAKINVNLGASNEIAHIRLAKEIMGLIAPLQYNTIFEQRDPSGQYSDRLQTCSALIDWSDMDEQSFNCDITTSAVQGGGVEDAWYQNLQKPYRRKNAPYDSLEELHMVRGIHEDFWATFVDPEPTNPKKRVMTVWGQGAVNVNTANAQTLLGVVCAGAPTADLCTDVNQAGLFLTGVTMARGISMGAPLFGNVQDFVATMKGKGAIGPVLAGLGLKPVKFQSDSEFAKSISTESKMFSIYAIGIKKGFKRETRVRVQAVVDFRSAAALTSSSTPPAAGTSAAVVGGQPSQNLTAAGASGAPIAGAMGPNTGGQIVYYRVD